jgi:hypothetical protein
MGTNVLVDGELFFSTVMLTVSDALLRAPSFTISSKVRFSSAVRPVGAVKCGLAVVLFSSVTVVPAV